MLGTLLTVGLVVSPLFAGVPESLRLFGITYGAIVATSYVAARYL